MKPSVNKIIMSSGRSTNVVTFSIKEMILRMVTRKSLFTTKNLHLNPKDPFVDPPESACYGEVNYGSWFKEVKKGMSLIKSYVNDFLSFHRWPICR